MSKKVGFEEVIRRYESVRDRLLAQAEKDLNAVFAKTTGVNFANMDVLTRKAYWAWVEKYGYAFSEVSAEMFHMLTGQPAFIADEKLRDVVRFEARNSYFSSFNTLREALAGGAETFTRIVSDLEEQAGQAFEKYREQLRASGARHIQNFGRETIRTNAKITPGVKYARIPRGSRTCDWCLMLANTNDVYHSETSAMGRYAYHDYCDCVAIPVIERYRDAYVQFADKRILAAEEANWEAWEESAQRGRGRPAKKPANGWASGRGGKDEKQWAKRERALKSDLRGEHLATHEIEFLERFEKLGHRAQWIPRAPYVEGQGRKPTNDFVWVDSGNKVCELKSTKVKYSTIVTRIVDARRLALKQGVDKDRFVIDLGVHGMPSKLKRRLEAFNLADGRSQKDQIKELWIMSKSGENFVRLI